MSRVGYSHGVKAFLCCRACTRDLFFGTPIHSRHQVPVVNMSLLETGVETGVAEWRQELLRGDRGS